MFASRIYCAIFFLSLFFFIFLFLNLHPRIFTVHSSTCTDTFHVRETTITSHMYLFIARAVTITLTLTVTYRNFQLNRESCHFPLFSFVGIASTLRFTKIQFACSSLENETRTSKCFILITYIKNIFFLFF